MMKFIALAVVVAGLAAAPSVPAQEAESESEEASQAGAEAPEADESAEAEALEAAGEEDAGTEPATPSRGGFGRPPAGTVSEEIKADTAVAFPVDI